MNALTLFQALEAIPDHRTKKGRRFPLPTILIIALAAMLSGANDLLAVARWGRRLSPKALQAIDGKRLRGSQHETSPGVHMLHAFSTKLRAAVGALKVPPDSGECIEALELIASLPLEGALVTGDAAFTTEAIARAIRERGGHYFLFVKDNQPELVSELERAFGDVPPCRDHRRGAGPHRRQAA